jgi:hypothetical protein
MARTPWAPVPQVNLLPSEILAARRFRRLRMQLVGVAVGVVAACGTAVVWSQAGVVAAQHDLETIEQAGTRLMKEQAKYARVPQVTAERDRVKAVRQAVLGADVLWYRFLSDLAMNTPPGTELTSVTVSMTGATTATSPTAIPLVTPGLGEVQVKGKALRFPDVAAWLDAVNRVHGLAGSGLTSAKKEDPGSSDEFTGAPGSDSTGSSAEADLITFNGSAVVVPAALSHRYDTKAS